MIHTIMSILGLGGSDDEQKVFGPDQIATARQQLNDDRRPEQATCGAPHLVQRGGDFADDYDVEIPLYVDADVVQPQPLTFDLTGDKLEHFVEQMGTTVEEIGAVEGATIPITWTDGTAVPDWNDPESSFGTTNET